MGQEECTRANRQEACVNGKLYQANGEEVEEFEFDIKQRRNETDDLRRTFFIEHEQIVAIPVIVARRFFQAVENTAENENECKVNGETDNEIFDMLGFKFTEQAKRRAKNGRENNVGVFRDIVNVHNVGYAERGRVAHCHGDNCPYRVDNQREMINAFATRKQHN